MLQFKTEKLTDRVTRIYGFCGELMYLVEGNKKAALLDTGTGIKSLKACVEQLTDKPVMVLLTHGHVDHAMGAPEFEEVYMNHKDDFIYNDHSFLEFRKEGLAGTPLEQEVEPADFIPEAPCVDFRELSGGDVFDLGDITIEIYDCPGHTPGSVVMLLPEERSVLLGDACNYFTFLFDSYSLTLTEYEESLKKLSGELEGKFDTVYLSHGDGDGHKEIIKDVIAVCEDIKAGNTDDVSFSFMGKRGLIAKAVTPQMGRKDGGRGNIVYCKERIYTVE